MLRILICLISLPLLACQELNQLLTVVAPVREIQSIIINYLKCKFVLDMKTMNSEKNRNVHCYFPDSKKMAQVTSGNKGTCIEIKDVFSNKILKTIVLDDVSGDHRSRIYYHFEVSFLSVSPDGNYLTIAALCKQTDVDQESEGDVVSDYGGGRFNYRETETSYPVIISCNIAQEKYICIENDIKKLGLNLQIIPTDLYYLPNGYLCIKNQQGFFLIDISQWSTTYSSFKSFFHQNSISQVNNKLITLKLHIPSFNGDIAISKDLKYAAYSGGNLNNNIAIDNQPLALIKIDDSIIPLALSLNGKDLAAMNKQNMYFGIYDITSGKWTYEFSSITDGIKLSELVTFSTDEKYLICQNKIVKADIKELTPNHSVSSADKKLKADPVGPVKPEDKKTCIIS